MVSLGPSDISTGDDNTCRGECDFQIFLRPTRWWYSVRVRPALYLNVLDIFEEVCNAPSALDGPHQHVCCRHGCRQPRPINGPLDRDLETERRQINVQPGEPGAEESDTHAGGGSRRRLPCGRGCGRCPRQNDTYGCHDD